MNRITENLRNAWRGLLALCVIALIPAVGEASGMGFRNDTKAPIYVQCSSIEKGQVKRGPLILIKPGQTAWDVNVPNGSRTITIYNASNQKLLQETRLYQGTDMFFTILPAQVKTGQPA